jgi:putative transposase
VKVLEELDRYPWSGHAVLLGKGKMKGQVVAEVLELFGRRIPAARKRYQEFVAAGVSMGKREDLVGGGLKKSLALEKNGLAYEAFDSRVLGSGEFVERLQGKEALKDRMKASLPLSAVVERVIEKGSSLLLTHRSCPDRNGICLGLFGSSIPTLGIMS